ncbi:YkvA family protein [Ectobacillus sp. JY-23]|uniref:YkvA family protein n=1 Tax=Ectobacillus sp. JY-23 TaxID=2933872 RepID=UPI001FF47764|nr:YkvA family protein [Ectobacillus sp. JY-23]UOY91100.1 YkvA family protein [Ectobacillus sp. JY-23]
METKFSPEAFWQKTKQVAKKAGYLVIYAALLLFYVLKKPEVPKRTKIAIIGALAYFIAPIDAVPDILAGIGYTDDLGALGAALVQAAMYIDDDIKGQAKEKLAEWFEGELDTGAIDSKLE